MPRPAKKILYTVLWDDGTFLSYELTNKDYEDLSNAMVEGKNAVLLSIGVLKVTDIRSVVEQKVEPEVKEERPAVPDNEMTFEQMEYLNEIVRPFYRRNEVS